MSSSPISHVAKASLKRLVSRHLPPQTLIQRHPRVCGDTANRRRVATDEATASAHTQAPSGRFCQIVAPCGVV